MLDHLCTKSKRQWWKHALRQERTLQVTSHWWQTLIGFNRNLCRNLHTVFLHTRYIVQSWSWAEWQWVYYVLLSSVWGFLVLFLSGCMNRVSSEWKLQSLYLKSYSGDFLNKFSRLCSAPNNVHTTCLLISSGEKLPECRTVGQHLIQYAVNIVPSQIIIGL